MGFTSMAVQIPGEPFDPPVPVGGLPGATAALTVPVPGEEPQEPLPFTCRAVSPPRVPAIEDPELWPRKRSAAVLEYPPWLERVRPGEDFLAAQRGESARHASKALDAAVVQVPNHCSQHFLWQARQFADGLIVVHCFN